MTAAVATPIRLELNRHFDAPPDRVFDAWLSKDLGDFVGPPGVKGEVTLIEPKVGGRYRIVMHLPSGGTLATGGVYREIARPSKLVMSWKWEHEEQNTLITLTFAAKDGGTDLTLLHEGFAAAERRDSHNNGWTGTLDKLAEWLKGE